MNSLLRGAGLALALLLFGASAAHADAIMYLDDTSTVGIDVIIADGAAIGTATDIGVSTNVDGSALAGVVSFNGSVGTWLVNVTTGISKPVFGPEPKIDLNSVNVSGGQGTIVIGFSDTGFTWPFDPVEAVLAFGGTTNGNVQLRATIDNGNQAFGGNPLGSASTSFITSVYSGGAFSDTVTFSGAAAGAFSLGVEIAINHEGTSVQSTSLDAELTVTPEPGSIALCGLAVLGFAVYRRRRKA